MSYFRLLEVKNDVSEDNFIWMKILCTLGCVISLFSSFFIITIYIINKNARNFAFKIVFYLMISDFCMNIGYLLTWGNYYENKTNSNTINTICLAQAIITTCFGLSSVIWTSIIAFTLYATVVKNVSNIEEKEKRYLFIGYAIPFLLSMIPLFTKDYGVNGLFCWLKDTDNSRAKSMILEFFYFYFILWIGFIYNSITIYLVIKSLKNVGITSEEQSWVFKLRFYPLILIICWGWASIQFISEIISWNNKNRIWLLFLHVFFSSLQGLFNAILYGLNGSVKKILKFNLCKCFFTQNKKDSIDGVELDDQYKQRTSLASTLTNDYYKRTSEDIGQSKLNMSEINEIVLK